MANLTITAADVARVLTSSTIERAIAGEEITPADLSSTDFVVVLGVATAADNLKVQIQISGVQVP